MTTKKKATKSKVSKRRSPVRPSNERVDDEKLKQALQESNGNISHAARVMGISRNAIHQHVNANSELKQILDDSRQTMLDEAENALLSAVREKQGWAVCFTLKTIGQERGYVERADQSHSGTVEVIIRRADRK
jgi:hypothetical protein